ncbi:hypothetical protein R52603_05099 [Paraburkholderia saeva]|jgi:hypothetical protein|uniref:Alpha/beta hydrolase n=1 Tax=Paraburkholderia saeva TaxID=2777537 RepID=A0A9N8RU64_9BURK|nr:hypothetical protein LMG31841_00979 [Paraburkholderia saeva]CAG4922716.1 hypothetical protein R52603_05099 [Paraburkholderia saeva]CAG4924985.1 hypothetical protein R70241_05321 [Paraburkholderia saeva]
MHLYRETSQAAGTTRLAVQDYGGTGEFIWLLHGAGRSAADWLPMAPLPAGHGRVIATNLRPLPAPRYNRARTW